MGLTTRSRRGTFTVAATIACDPVAMLRNPIIVCLALAAIVVIAAIAEAVVILTTRRRRIAW